MEYALHIKKLEELSRWDSYYSRVYVGSEFCSKLMFSLPELEEVVSFVRSRNMGLSIATSYCNESNLPTYKMAIDFIRKEYPEAEIIVNDWGVFNICVAFSVKTVIGRLLVKQKRDPRIFDVLDNLSSEAKSRVMDIGLNDSILNFLKSKNIKRIELNNVSQGVNLENIKNDFDFSLHVPFVCVSVTRYCGSEFKNKPDKFGIKECQAKACKNIELYNKDLKKIIFRSGNAFFYKNYTLPENIQYSKIDRIVYDSKIENNQH
jgi:hypothetical protein